MADAWPDSLPQNFVGGYADGEPDNLIETSPDTGPPISRARSSAGVRNLSGSMRMTRTQLATLHTFFNTTLISGSLPFNFPDPSFGGTVLVKFPKSKQPTWQQINASAYMVGISLLVLP